MNFIHDLIMYVNIERLIQIQLRKIVHVKDNLIKYNQR